MQAVQVAD